MDSIQEAFLMLGIAPEKLAALPLFQKYALILHSVNLKHGFKLTGFQEDDPKQGKKYHLKLFLRKRVPA